LHENGERVDCDLEDAAQPRQARTVKQHRLGQTALIPVQRIERSIVRLRGHNVLLDRDLAALYRVDVRALNQAVKRSRERFPSDFMFQLTAQEAESLRSQTVILNAGRGRHRKYQPFVFTEQGVAMLSSVLRSGRAVQVNIEIMRAFVGLRRTHQGHVELAGCLTALQRKYDGQFDVVFEALKELTASHVKPRKRIGFQH
jgi:hypothetical protein